MATRQTAFILGLGASGRSAALLLRARGWEVLALDESDNAKLRELTAPLEAAGAVVALGARALPAETPDLAVTSPGLPPDHPWLAALRTGGAKIVPEFELGWSLWNGRTIAVTGSNGKSSVVKWIAEALRVAGHAATPCGNYGTPVCDLVREGASGWAVVEASSFQLEASAAFRADVGVLLNLVPNHLDRHPDFDAYARAKARLFAFARAGDACIVPLEERDRIARLSGGAGTWTTFGGAGAEWTWRDSRVWRQDREVADLRGTYFGNDVLGFNAAAALAALAAAGAPAAAAVASARAFEPLPHRMQPVGTVRGVCFINDSKATTLAALSAAVRMAPGRVRLIAGGILKEKDLSVAESALRGRVAAAYLIGQSADRLAAAWSGLVPCAVCGTLEAAVRQAFAEAVAGEVVLLSTGCASFDQFAGFSHRGEAFVALVKDLMGSYT